MVNNIEEFMYKFMACLCSMNVPIVFKGAMLLKVIQQQYGNPSGIERETHDLDGDWVNGSPSMEYLTQVLQQAVINTGYTEVIVEPYRNYGVGKSAGFRFIDCNNKEITTMDLSICQNSFSCKYYLVSGLSFYGQSINKIIADKIQVCSKRTIMRRIKDVIDLYILSFIWKGSNCDIISLSNYLNRSFEDFDRFINNYSDLEHAYSKYKNKASILPFRQIYDRVYTFLEPFIKKINYSMFWDGNNWR